jgi:uncharacterized protein YutD
MDTVTTLPAIVPVDPQIIKNETTFEWNYEAIQQYLSSVTEKYDRLVVTDENVDDMGKAKREVVSLRTHLQKFERATKTVLKKPAEDFSYQCRNLYGIIAAVETPLNAQLQEYDNRRGDDLKAQISRELKAKSAAVDVRDETLEEFEFNPKWTNKTAKWSDIVVDIDHEVIRLKSLQQANDDREQLRKDRQEMVQAYVDTANAKYGLHTPLKIDEFMSSDLLDQGLSVIKETIFSAAQNIKAVETAAVQQSDIKTQDTPPLPPLPPIPQANGNYKDMIITIHHVHMDDYDRVCMALDKLSYPYDVDLR